MAGDKLEKAYLEIREAEPKESSGSGSRDHRQPGSKIDELTCHFNPKEYTTRKSANWERKNQKGARRAAFPQFKGAGPVSLSLELFLDASESASGRIAEEVDKLFACCVPTERTHTDTKPHPPLVNFMWGAATSFTAIVKSVSAKYTLFRPDGTPTRAVCTVDLEEYPTPAQRQNPTSGALAAHRTRTVRAGDSLASIAYDEYGSAALWRAVAAINGVEDPMRLPVGTSLLIPPALEAAEHA